MRNFIFLVGLLMKLDSAIALENQYVVGVIGDSISVGFDANRIGDNKEFSWAGGQDKRARVESHALQLQELLGKPVKVYNFADAGSETIDLIEQSKNLSAHKPDYVTILIGANDLCRMKDGVSWQSARKIIDVENSIKKLIVANSMVKIVVVSVPDMVRLRDVGIEHGCQIKWNVTGLCKPLLAKDKTDEDRRIFGERRDNFNVALEKMTLKFPQNVRYDASIADFNFEWDYISKIDCFHPSVLGQNKIGQITFDPTWY